MSMIVSHILGGIGNQMFQYATGRALSQASDQHFSVDLKDFSNYRLHNGYELNRVFNVNVEYADEQVVKDMLKWRSNNLAMKVLRRSQFECLRGDAFVVEPFFNYWAGLKKRTGDSYLFGYWQSELYFKLFENIIRQDFSFRHPLKGENSTLAEAIKNTQSISIHVRRGDYINDAKSGAVMEVCSLDYYRKAINYIAERVNSPVFYIFSDDIKWVKQALEIKFPCTFVGHNIGQESYRDMQLMSLCQHNIMANSSFSWWGAWLNSNEDKLIVAPKNWFRNGTDDKDLIPEKWGRL